MTEPRYLIAFATTALLTTGGFMLMPFSSAYIVGNLGVSLESLPTLYLVTGLCTIVVGPLIGKAADALGHFRVFTLGSALSIYQQTFIDIYSKLAFVKLYDRKNALTAADMPNDRVLPFFEEQGVPLLRILTDRGSEYCGNRESHEYALYLDLENIEHTRTKTRSPQTNGFASASTKRSRTSLRQRIPPQAVSLAGRIAS